MFGNGLAKGFSIHRVMEGHIGRTLCHPRATRRNIDAPQLKATGNLLEAPAFFSAHQIVRGDPEVLKNQFGAVDRTVTQFLELFADTEALTLLADKEAHATVRRRGGGIGLGEYGETVALNAVGDPGLGAVKNVVITIFLGDQTNTLQV